MDVHVIAIQLEWLCLSGNVGNAQHCIWDKGIITWIKPCGMQLNIKTNKGETQLNIPV